MRSNYKSFVVCSVSQHDNNDADLENSRYFTKALTILGIPFKPVIGYYNNKNELSFMLEYSDFNMEIVRQVMRQFNQESILYMDNEGTGYLIYSDGKQENIGKLTLLDSVPLGDYTYIPDSQEYFIFRR